MAEKAENEEVKDVVPEGEDGEQPSESEIDYEAEARKQGWCPQEEWRGDPKAWKSAQEFYETGLKIQPILEARLRKYEAEIEHLKTTAGQHQQFYESAMERQKREAQQEIADLKRQRAEAISNADGDTVNQIDDRIDALRQNQQQSANAVPPEVQPHLEAFKSRNSWYGTDNQLTKYADYVATQVGQMMPNASYADKFAEVERQVRDTFPHKFESPKPPGPEGGQHGAPRKKRGKSYEDLPKDAKAACDNFCKTIPGFTKQKFLDQYDWSE